MTSAPVTASTSVELAAPESHPTQPANGVLNTPAPEGVVDWESWWMGDALHREHQPDPHNPARCAHPLCDEPYPCPPRRLGDQLLAASQQTTARRRRVTR